MRHTATVIDFAAYRRTRDLPLVVDADLTREAIARVAFLMTPAPVVFWFIFWRAWPATSAALSGALDFKDRGTHD